MMFFFARAAHYTVYALGLPLVRTLLFIVGVGCQILLAGRLLQCSVRLGNATPVHTSLELSGEQISCECRNYLKSRS